LQGGVGFLRLSGRGLHANRRRLHRSASQRRRNAPCYLADMSKNIAQSAPPSEAGFIDTATILQRLPISRRTLATWLTSGKIPFVNVTGRRVLFHWKSVEEALLRLQRGGSQ
jgi:excisionase family DNA binding protein